MYDPDVFRRMDRAEVFRREKIRPSQGFRRAARKQGVHTEPEIRQRAEMVVDWLWQELEELRVWQRLARWAIKYVLKRLGA